MEKINKILDWIAWLICETASWIFALVLVIPVYLGMLIIKIVRYHLEHHRKEKITEMVWVPGKGYIKKGG